MRRLAIVVALIVSAACGGGSEEREETTRSPVSTTTTTSLAAGAEPTTTAPPTAADGSPASTTTTAATRTGTASAASASQQSSTPEDTRTPELAHVLSPKPGRYVYATEGFSETGSGPTARREPMPSTTTDDVTSAGEELTILTDYGDGSTQEARYIARPAEVLLARLTFTTTTSGVPSSQAVAPQPPILVMRAPLRVGDKWESTWEDPTLGVQGVGTGEVRARDGNAFVVHLDHRLRGSITGRLQLTIWLDPTTGTRVRDESVLDITAAANPSHFELKRALQSAP